MGDMKMFGGKGERDGQFNTCLLRKMRSIKDGEFPRLFKREEPKLRKESGLIIPRKQMDKFEELKRTRLQLGTKVEVKEEPKPANGMQFVRRSDFDRIMWNRERLKRARYGYKDEECSQGAGTFSNAPSASAAKKINEGKLRAWVDKCYNTIHNAETARLPKDLKRLAQGDEIRKEVDIVQRPDDKQETESSLSLDADLSDQEGESSSLLSEMVLRKKATAGGAADPSRSSAGDTRWSTGGKRPEKHLAAREGVNSVLGDFYIEDLKDLKSLAYNEELYAYDKANGQIVGSWRVNAKVCEDNENCINMQFEGLISEPNSDWVMYSSGLVDKNFTPLTEFRIEQNIERTGESRSKIMFFHRKQRKWLFDVRETAGKTETRKSFGADYQHMQRVLTESAHLLLVRKAIMYRYPLNFEENDDDYQYTTPCDRVCACTEAAGECGCKYEFPLKVRKKFRLKMRAVTIGGDIVRCNYRFYTPVNVKFHEVDLKVVRVRRRLEMPGKLIQNSNYFITTAGQLMAVTFNDPYPYETNYYLQIDPKSVLDPSRVIPPERIVPLRERYMCDPELRQFYESEVLRFTNINRQFLSQHIRMYNGIKAVFQDLLNDKPHRIFDYVNNFFFEGYKFVEKECQHRWRRRRKERDEDDIWPISNSK